MKILCVVPSYWPAFKYGGPIYSVHNLNKALVKKGVDITVYTTNVGIDEKSTPHASCLESDIDGVKVHYFAFTKFFEFMGATGWQFSLSMRRALKNNLKAFDLVHIISVWNYPVTISAYYCRKYKKPYIISPRGLLYPYTARKKLWKKLPYYYLVARRDLKGASAIHYTTEDEAEKCHLSLGLKNKSIVIPNGIELSEFKSFPTREELGEHYPILKGKKVILFLGRIHWIKGVDILVRAYAMLTKERNDIHLLIVGNDEGGYKEKVIKWIKGYGLEYQDYGLRDRNYGKGARVTFTGMLTGKEKLEAFAGSDIFVLPSYSENFGMAVVEAMAAGLPVIISNKVGIYREVQENKAGIVVDTNAESLYKGIKLLLENSELREETARNGRKMVEEYYNIDKVAERMIKAYEEMLERGEK